MEQTTVTIQRAVDAIRSINELFEGDRHSVRIQLNVVRFLVGGAFYAKAMEQYQREIIISNK